MRNPKKVGSLGPSTPSRISPTSEESGRSPRRNLCAAGAHHPPLAMGFLKIWELVL